MASKLIIFVAMASLAQSSFALRPLAVNYGLTDEQLAPLTQIIVNQDATVQAKFDALDPIFDIIGKYASALVWNVEAKSDDDTSKIAGALARGKDSMDYTLDAVLIALQKSCDAVEVARNTTFADVDQVYAAAGDALALALSGNYSENRAQLEVYEADVQDDFARLVGSVFDSIRTCTGTTDAATLAQIKIAQDGSGLALVHLTNALFNAIKSLAAAVTAGTANVSLIQNIETARRHAHISLRSDVENGFSGMKTIYLSTQLDATEIVTPLGQNQYTLTVSFYRYQTEVEAIYDTISASLVNVSLGLYDPGHADFSVTDGVQAKALAKLAAAHEVFLVSVLSVHPDATSAVAAAREKFATVSPQILGSVYRAIHAAGFATSNDNDATAEIEALRDSVLLHDAPYTDLIFNLIRNGETLDDDSESQFRSLQQAATGQLISVTNNIFDSIAVIAKARSANEASDDDFSAIQTDRAATISAFDIFTQDISAAGVIVIKAAQAN